MAARSSAASFPPALQEKSLIYGHRCAMGGQLTAVSSRCSCSCWAAHNCDLFGREDSCHWRDLVCLAPRSGVATRRPKATISDRVARARRKIGGTGSRLATSAPHLARDEGGKAIGTWSGATAITAALKRCSRGWLIPDISGAQCCCAEIFRSRWRSLPHLVARCSVPDGRVKSRASWISWVALAPPAWARSFTA